MYLVSYILDLIAKPCNTDLGHRVHIIQYQQCKTSYKLIENPAASVNTLGLKQTHRMFEF